MVNFNFSTGATLVKDSVPVEEVRETAAKSRAILRPLLTRSSRKVVVPPFLPGLHNDDDIVETLNRRNQDLSNFWFFKQERAGDFSSSFHKKSITLIDNGDDFIYMLRHIFTSLGISSTIVNYQDYQSGKDTADITLLGPGPGNPNNESDEKIVKNMDIAATLLSSGKKALFVCLGHQILCRCLGYIVQKKEKPLQGSQLEIDLFGHQEKVGFYNTFAGRKVPGDTKHEYATLGASDELVAIKGENFIGYQFHPESILTKNGFVILQQALVHLMRNPG